jgi:hypothetical protein
MAVDDDNSVDSSILTDLRQAQHREWKEENVDVIRSSHIPYRSANNGESLIFRESGKPKVDFYPSTGRWRVVSGSSRTMGGHAMQFLEWYAEQKA